MRKDIERVVEVFEEFRAHPAITGEFYTANKGLIAASLTAAYFANNETKETVVRKAKATRKKR